MGHPTFSDIPDAALQIEHQKVGRVILLSALFLMLTHWYCAAEAARLTSICTAKLTAMLHVLTDCCIH